MRIALDTNLLVYAEGVNQAERRAEIRSMLDALSERPLIIPLQVLGELFNVLTRKARWPAERARAAVTTWTEFATVRLTSADAFAAALALAVEHRLSIWDAVIVSVAAEAGCGLLLSEDMGDGFVWRGMTVVDPFKAERHPLLVSVLRRK
jgi:predicted nucleic acid-binding protein